MEMSHLSFICARPSNIMPEALKLRFIKASAELSVRSSWTQPPGMNGQIVSILTPKSGPLEAPQP